MDLNARYIFIGTLCLFLILGITCVFASDNTTCNGNIDLSDVADSSLNLPVTTDEQVNIEKNTLSEDFANQLNKDMDYGSIYNSDKNHNISSNELTYQKENIVQQNNTLLNGNNTIITLNTNNFEPLQKYNQIKCIFAGEEINIDSIISSTITNGHINGIIKNSTVYSATYNNETHEFILCLYKEVNNRIVYEKIYKFNNVTDASEIFSKLENKQYTPIMTLTINTDINSIQDYMNIINSNVNTVLQPFKNSISDNEIAEEINRCTQNNHEYSFKTCLNVNFKKTLDFECSNTWDFFSNYFDIININGNGSRIYSKFDDSEEYVFARLTEGKILSISNLTITGFNQGIVNIKGLCICNWVTFDCNKMDYWTKKDYGAGIYNEGLSICNNCTFTNNYCKYGAAIYNPGVLISNNNTFAYNMAYGKGSNIANVNGGLVILDGNKTQETDDDLITHFNNSNELTNAKTVCGFLLMLTVVCLGGAVISLIAGSLTLFVYIGIAGIGFALSTIICLDYISDLHEELNKMANNTSIDVPKINFLMNEHSSANPII